jgi:hypothetical protein
MANNHARLLSVAPVRRDRVLSAAALAHGTGRPDSARRAAGAPAGCRQLCPHRATVPEVRRSGSRLGRAELVWLAETLGTPRIATLDVAHFSVYRIHRRKRFELELLR